MPTPLRQAVRRHVRAPGFTATVMLTIALGIGLASATGVVARAVAFAGLPMRDAGRVVVLWGVDRAGSFARMPLPPTSFAGLSTAMRGVATVAAGDYNGAYPWPFHPADAGGSPLRLRGTLAGGNYFDVLGARPILGRTLRQDDDVIGAPRVMVLSHAAWRRHFGSDPAVIGRSLRAVIWGEGYTIVGVMPPGLDMPRGVEFWTAFAPTASRNGSLNDSWFGVHVVARLATGATPEQASQVLTSYYATLARAGQAEWIGARATARTVPQLVTGDVRPAFTALGAAAVVVLLVTCGNVAGLLLVRAGKRRREFAVRAALGAGRGRLVRSLLGEHALLAVLGGALGAVLAVATVRAFAALAPAELPRIDDLGVDWTLFAAVAGVTALVVLIVGAIPAVAATQVAPAAALGGGREGIGGRSADVRARRFLVGAQVALALVVLSGASLVGRSLAHLTTLDLGVATPERLSFVELVPSATGGAIADRAGENRTPLDRWFDRQDAIMDRVRAAPGVLAVAPVVHEPYAGSAGWDAPIEAESAPAADSARRPYFNMEITNADYLRVMGVPLVRGRWLAASDIKDAPLVVALSERAAGLLFPNEQAVGRRVKLSDDRMATVVGVVGDTRFREFLEPRPSIYFPYRQESGGALFLAVRTQGTSANVAGVVRRAVSEVAPEMLVQDHGTLRSRLAEQLARPRLIAGVLGTYAVVVILLAVTGLYAVVAASVAGRRREFGVRAALGASPRSLAVLVLTEGLRVAVVGLVPGLVGALAGSRLLTTLLHGVAPTEPTTLATASVALLAVCALAVLLPARRAARADPARELRAE